MTIKIIKHYIILLVVFFSWVGVANADVVFNEIAWMGAQGNQYGEWIELYNNGNKSVNLSGFSIFKGDGTTLLFTLSKTIDANGFLLIERTTPSSSDPIPGINDESGSFGGSGLVNFPKGEHLILKYKSENPIADIDFSSDGWPDGYNGDYKTMQWDGNKWIYANKTPGAVNSGVSDNNSFDNSSEDNTVDENVDSIPVVKDTPEIFKITTKIISPKIVTAGIPFSLSSLTTTNRGETYAVGKFVWNFGDGMIKEVGQSNPFEYMYEYSGEYALTISYYDSVFSINPDAVDRLTIKVVPSGINISSVGTISDPFVEIENKSSYEIILSNWIVTAGIHHFIIPEGMTLLSNKKIKLSPKITGFVGEDIKLVIITNPNKEIIATYPTEIKKPIQKVASVNKTTNINPVPTNNPQNDSLLKDSQVINLNDLGASVQEVGINIPNSTYPIIGLLVVIGLGIASFLLIKKRRDVDDYVEKGIRAEDMTIIE